MQRQLDERRARRYDVGANKHKLIERTAKQQYVRLAKTENGRALAALYRSYRFARRTARVI